MGVTVIPILGGLVGAGLGAGALAAIRRRPDLWAGHGMAATGFGLGLAFGVVPTIAFFALELEAGHHSWAIIPLAVTVAYGLAVVTVAIRASRAAAAISTLGIIGGAAALGAAALLAVGGAILFIDAIKALVRYIFTSTKCAVTHGGGTGKHCTTNGR